MIERPLYAQVIPHNAGSIRVHEKCGFRFERAERFEDGGSDVIEFVFVLK